MGEDMNLMKFFSKKLIKQLLTLTILTFTLTSHAMNKIVPYEEPAEISPAEISPAEIPIEVLAFVGTFLEERELFIIARWHKTPEERTYILESSSREKKIRFDQKLETYQQHKKKLRFKKDRLYTKFALRTCSCGTQLLVKIPLWITLFCTNFICETTRMVCVGTTGLVAGICGCIWCNPQKGCQFGMDSCADCLCSGVPEYSRHGCYPECLIDECWSVPAPCDSFIEDRREIEYLESQIIERN
mgnify:CR=1 FL=1